MTAQGHDPAADNVIPFQQGPATGDWTRVEIERLSELTRKLSAQGGSVDVVYGISDAGDPWCVITNGADEVLIHVARIDGRFVIHDAAADAVQDGGTLSSALDRVLGDSWREGRREGVVIPFGDAHALLALVVAVLGHEIQDGHFEPAAPGSHLPPATGASTTASASAALGAAALDPHGVAPLDGVSRSADDNAPRWPGAGLRLAESARAGPVPATTAAGAPQESGFILSEQGPAESPQASQIAAPLGGVENPLGGAGLAVAAETANELLIAARGGGHLVGGLGDDTLVGAGARPGEAELLDGGAGNDRLVLTAQTVAVGGPGHDVFVIAGPAVPHQPPVHAPPSPPAPSGPPAAPSSPPAQTGPSSPAVQSHPPPTVVGALQGGVILDFTLEDRLEFSGGRPATVVSIHPVADVLADLHGAVALARFGATPGEQVGFDLDGDGAADIYVLMAGPGASSLTVGQTFGDPIASHSAQGGNPGPATLGLFHGDFLFGQ